MKLKTHRLLIRYFQASDQEDLNEMLTDQQVMKSTGLRTIQSPNQCHSLLQAWVNDPEIFAVCLEEKVIGWAMLKTRDRGTELGFMFSRKYWSQGHASELVKYLSRWFLIKGNQELLARTDVDNLGSQRVLQKNGFSEIEREEGSICFRLTLDNLS